MVNPLVYPSPQSLSLKLYWYTSYTQCCCGRIKPLISFVTIQKRKIAFLCLSLPYSGIIFLFTCFGNCFLISKGLEISSRQMHNWDSLTDKKQPLVSVSGGNTRRPTENQQGNLIRRQLNSYVGFFWRLFLSAFLCMRGVSVCKCHLRCSATARCPAAGLSVFKESSKSCRWKWPTHVDRSPPSAHSTFPLRLRRRTCEAQRASGHAAQAVCKQPDVPAGGYRDRHAAWKKYQQTVTWK